MSFPLDVTLNIFIDGIELEHISHFIYLGCSLSCNESLNNKFWRRIGEVSNSFADLGFQEHQGCRFQYLWTAIFRWH